MGSKTEEITDPSFDLSAVLERIATGEEIIISRDGVPLARLSPVKAPKKERVPGKRQGSLRRP